MCVKSIYKQMSEQTIWLMDCCTQNSLAWQLKWTVTLAYVYLPCKLSYNLIIDSAKQIQQTHKQVDIILSKNQTLTIATNT